MLWLIDRFGVQGVVGTRALGVKEMRGMVLAENIHRLYGERAKAENWVSWVREHPRENETLTWAHHALAAEQEAHPDGRE